LALKKLEKVWAKVGYGGVQLGCWFFDQFFAILMALERFKRRDGNNFIVELIKTRRLMPHMPGVNRPVTSQN
jgi:hypothetical protein